MAGGARGLGQRRRRPSRAAIARWAAPGPAGPCGGDCLIARGPTHVTEHALKAMRRALFALLAVCLAVVMRRLSPVLLKGSDTVLLTGLLRPEARNYHIEWHGNPRDKNTVQNWQQSPKSIATNGIQPATVWDRLRALWWIVARIHLIDWTPVKLRDARALQLRERMQFSDISGKEEDVRFERAFLERHGFVKVALPGYARVGTEEAMESLRRAASAKMKQLFPESVDISAVLSATRGPGHSMSAVAGMHFDFIPRTSDDHKVASPEGALHRWIARGHDVQDMIFWGAFKPINVKTPVCQNNLALLVLV